MTDKLWKNLTIFLRTFVNRAPESSATDPGRPCISCCSCPCL